MGVVARQTPTKRKHPRKTWRGEPVFHLPEHASDPPPTWLNPPTFLSKKKPFRLAQGGCLLHGHRCQKADLWPFVDFPVFATCFARIPQDIRQNFTTTTRWSALIVNLQNPPSQMGGFKLGWGDPCPPFFGGSLLHKKKPRSSCKGPKP